MALLGSAYLQNKEFQRGSELLEKAAEIAPDLAAIRTQLALSQLATGRTDMAVSELESVVEMDEGLVQADILLVLIHIREKQFDKAINVATTMVEKQPDNPVPHNLLSAAYLGKGDKRKAREQLEKALQVDPTFITAQLNLAKLDIQENQLKAARGHYDEVLAIQKGSLEAMLGIAQMEDRAGRTGSAIEWVQKAHNANPEAIQPAVLLAGHNVAKGNILKAQSIMRELEIKYPDHPAVLAIQGKVQLAAKDYVNAADTYKKLITLQPTSIQAHYMLARASILNDDYKDVRDYINKALTLDQRHLPSLVLLAELELKEGDVSKTREIAKRIQALYPKLGIGFKLEGDVERMGGSLENESQLYEKAYKIQPTAQYAILLYQARKKSGADMKDVLAPLQDWVDLDPNDSDTRLLLATEYQSQSRNSEAISEYELVKEHQPKNAVVWNNLAWLYFIRGDSRSVEYAEKAVEISPNRPEIMDTLGWILLNTGNLERGLSVIQDAAIHAPHIPSIRFHLAVALHKQGNNKDARKELERLMKSGVAFSEKEEAKNLLKRLK
jgi:putative PEP-CTERM system TPR-repeat lipoprotein